MTSDITKILELLKAHSKNITELQELNTKMLKNMDILYENQEATNQAVIKLMETTGLIPLEYTPKKIMHDVGFG